MLDYGRKWGFYNCLYTEQNFWQPMVIANSIFFRLEKAHDDYRILKLHYLSGFQLNLNTKHKFLETIWKEIKDFM